MSVKKIVSSFRVVVGRQTVDTTTEGGRSQYRYKQATRSGLAAVFAKAISLTVSIITVPLTLKYLGVERYGMWMTISSIVAMFSFADLGMGDGLINLVASANGIDDHDAVRHAVSTAFWILSLIAFLLLVVMACIYPVIPWQRVFNVQTAQAVSESGPSLAVLLTCFLVNLPLGIVRSIQNGLQRGFIANLWAAAGSIISLVAVLWAIQRHAGLPVLILGLSGAPLFASVCNAAQLFLVDRPWLLPRISFCSRPTALRLLETGLMFFCLQLAAALGYQSDNLVIAHLLGAKVVASYAVPSRLFNVLLVLVGMISSPLWPAYADAIAKGDSQWVRKTFLRTIVGVDSLTLVATFFMVIFGNRLLFLWVGPGLNASFALLAAFGIRCILSAYLQPLSFLLNGVGKLRAQAAMAVLMSVVNLALSIILVKKMGIIGAILGTVASELFIVVIPQTILANRVLKQLDAR